MKKLFSYSLFKWEYWPSYLFYIPNLPYAFYLAAKAKHLAFFSAANPAIFSSGNGLESKYETLQLIPESICPKTILHKSNYPINDTIDAIKKAEIDFPLIVKPDIGFRGLLVTKMDSENELIHFLTKYPIDFVVQEFIAYPNECGIFYHRKPGDKHGKISSITLKRFLSITGNGSATLGELIDKDPRAYRYLNDIKNNSSLDLNMILDIGQSITVSCIGNHSKGTQFLDGNHLITDKLTTVLDRLCDQIQGWHYGRIDLKYQDFEELEKGNGFKILEINGIISEPTHMYDSEKYSYLYALKTIRQHWRYLYEVATTNHNTLATPYKSPATFIKEMRTLKAYTNKIKSLASS